MHVQSHMRRRPKRQQAGMTTLGLVIFCSFVGLFAFAGIRLVPVYLNYMKIAGAVSSVQTELEGTNATRGAIRDSLSRRFDVEMVGEITAKDIKISKVDGGHEVAAQYSHKSPFIANISFVVDFDKRVVVRR